MTLNGISENYRTREACPTDVPLPTPPERPTMPYAQQIHIQVNAETYFNTDNFDRCLAIYHELCFLHKPTAKILFNIGQLHLRKSNLRESVSWFENAIRRDPFLAVAHFQVGSIYVRLRRLKDARKAYTRCFNVALRGSIMSAGAGTGDIDYDQIGLQYRLCCRDIEHNQRLCAGLMDIHHAMVRPTMSKGPVCLDKDERLISVPARLIFRVPEKIAKARKTKPAETAEWRFRDEARVVAEVPTDSGKMGAWG